MLACPQIPWFVYTNAKKAWVRSLFLSFYKFFMVFYSYADTVAVHSNYFLLFFQTLRRKKKPLIGHAVTQNYVLEVFQPKQLKNFPRLYDQTR